MIGAFLDSIPAATVRTIFADRVTATSERIRVWMGQQPGRRMAACHLEPLLPLRQLVDTTVRELAEVTLAIWPRWYGRDMGAMARGDAVPTLFEQIFPAPPPASRRGEISIGWLQEAVGRVTQRRTPVVPGLARGRQVHQLALAIEPESLLFVLSTTGGPPDRLLGLARLAEWLARHSQCPVCVIVPHRLKNATSLSSIAYGAIDQIDEPGAVPAPSRCEQKQRIWPLVGQPHPFSPGEQLLAGQLRKDPKLRDLFEFNVWAETTCDRHYLVDLLWRAGRLVVEVDGFTTHTSREVFASDRQRDFELVASGYLVLRLTHDEILRDTSQAIGKIHQVVQVAARRGELPRTRYPADAALSEGEPTA